MALDVVYKELDDLIKETIARFGTVKKDTKNKSLTQPDFEKPTKKVLSEVLITAFAAMDRSKNAHKKLGDQIKDITQRNTELEAQVQKLNDEKEKIKQELQKSTESELKGEITMSDIKEAVKELLPDVVKETVAVALKDKKIINTYAEALTKTQDKVVKKAGDAFDNSLEKALVKNQRKTNERANVEEYERRNRARNVVITGIPESTSEESADRIAHDKAAIVTECTIDGNMIERCYRAGRVHEQGLRPSKPRPLVVVLSKPQLAQELHGYGTGQKIANEIWINPDLTRSERTVAYNARRARRTSAPMSISVPIDMVFED